MPLLVELGTSGAQGSTRVIEPAAKLVDDRLGGDGRIGGIEVHGGGAVGTDLGIVDDREQVLRVTRVEAVVVGDRDFDSLGVGVHRRRRGGAAKVLREVVQQTHLVGQPGAVFLGRGE